MKIYLVGGAVRDQLLGIPVKERDYVVVGATVAEMLRLGYRQVGKEFPVFLHPTTNEEYALARMERKIGPGYKGFTFDTSPDVALEADLERRDLTINAMARDLDTDQLIDPYGGQQDLQHQVLRHVSKAFVEDPVRILRVGRFLARFASLGFQVAPETLALMQDMVAKGEVNALVAERVWKELERALGENNPEKFFEVLAECGALPILFPHLEREGAGILALKKAADGKPVRFAALLHAIPEDSTDKSDAKKMITALCHRYRAPTLYQQVAVLTALYADSALHLSSLSAEAILTLFSALDIFRREARFQDFISACEAIALSRGQPFDLTQLQDCAKAAKSVDVQALVAQKLDNAALAARLREERLKAISQWLKTRRPLSSSNGLL